ncbi:hypothetical protein E2C01_074138 [Portunus trituberculatus]|uniref:Uncharacterized protein n=1 Tax=Portunus trituberculatus TaxID=210409 RepID=A0A5B7I788_PORTR|nr:hypothetical protein [Portunus trituberculatus]
MGEGRRVRLAPVQRLLSTHLSSLTLHPAAVTITSKSRSYLPLPARRDAAACLCRRQHHHHRHHHTASPLASLRGAWDKLRGVLSLRRWRGGGGMRELVPNRGRPQGFPIPSPQPLLSPAPPRPPPRPSHCHSGTRSPPHSVSPPARPPSSGVSVSA